MKSYSLRPGVRYRSRISLFGFPLVHIALGPDLERGEWRGVARGVIAIGDLAFGLLFAAGGVSLGFFSFGGVALGVATFGGVSLGLGLAIGGLAIGAVALGGAAVGVIAVGGAAFGYLAAGGGASGVHVYSASRADPVAVNFFQGYSALALQFLRGFLPGTPPAGGP